MDKVTDLKPSDSTVQYRLVSNTYQLVESDGDSASDFYRRSNEVKEISENTCRFCDLQFSGWEKLTIHMKTHWGLKRYVCLYCDKTFSERSSMVNHKRLHLNRNACKFICGICGKRFPQLFALNRHRRIHEKTTTTDTPTELQNVISENSKDMSMDAQTSAPSIENSEIMFEISYEKTAQSSTSQGLETNVSSQNDNKTSEIICRFCDLPFETEDNLNLHMVCHSGLRPFVCTQCGQTFTERSSMVTHKKLHLGPTAYKYECDLCGRRFAKASTLVRHKHTHTGEKPFTCTLCQKSYVNQYTLKTHIANVHFKDRSKSKFYEGYRKSRVDVFVSGDSDKNGVEQKILSCDKCGKVFTWNSSLVSHKVNHHGFRPYQCDVCGKTFPRKSVLRLHLFSHFNYKPHTCEDCGKRCSTKSSLNFHIKIHSHERPFHCDTCGRNFKFKSDLDKHLKIHSATRETFECTICSKTYVTKAGLDAHNVRLHDGEEERKPKEFKCQWCPFVCSNRNYLGKHTVTHTGQKDHMCEVCGRAFSFEYSLKRHRLMHVSARNHQCTMCDKSFFVVYDLHRHMRMHSDERPYKCEDCEKAFKTPVCLSKHKKKVHPETFITVYVTNA